MTEGTPLQRPDESDVDYALRLHDFARQTTGSSRRSALLRAFLRAGRTGANPELEGIHATLTRERPELPEADRPHWDSLIAAAANTLGRGVDEAMSAWAAATQLSDPALRAEAKLMWSAGAIRMGRIDEAIATMNEARLLFDAVGDRERVGTIFNNLSSAYLTGDRFADSVVAARQAIAIREAIGDLRQLPSSLANLGVSLMHLGDFHNAIPAIHRAVTIEARVPRSRRLGFYQSNLALAYAAVGDHEAALEAIQAAHQVPAGATAYDRASPSTYVEALCHMARGDMAATSAALENALQYSTNPEIHNEAQALSALVYARLGRPADALEAIAKTLAVTKLSAEARARVAQARAWLAIDARDPDSGKRFDEAAEIAEAASSALVADEVLEGRIAFAEQKGDLAVALAWTRRLHALRLKRIHQVRGAQIAAARAEYETFQVQARADAAEAERARIQEAHDRLADAAEARRVALGVIVHDLRNPLTAISSRAEAMLESLLQDEPDVTGAIDDAHDILAASQVLSRRLDELLRQQTLDERQVHPVPGLRIDELALRTLRSHAARARTKAIRLEPDPSSPPHLTAHADPSFLEEVLDNLLANAIKFSPMCGLVRLGWFEDGPNAVLVVTDHGPGFTPDDRTRLFHRFARLSARPTAGESSTGLGLFSVKQLVDKLDGEITLRDTPGGGATFQVALPRFPPVAAVSRARSP